MTPFAPWLDATLLSHLASEDDIVKLCDMAKNVKAAAVCVYPQYYAVVHRELDGSGVALCTVADFPDGASSWKERRVLVKELARMGWDEVDVVAPLKWLQTNPVSMNWLYADLAVHAQSLHAHNTQMKLILETELLAPDLWERVARIATTLSVDYLKTSTGMHGGANVDVVRTLAAIHPRIKASGGIRTRAAAEALLSAGASRIGSSMNVDALR